MIYRMHLHKILLLMSVAVLWAVTPSFGGLGLKTLQTKDLRLIYYDDEHEYVIPHLARCFENSMGFHRRLFDYTPSEPVTVLLQDFDDYGFAGASTLPSNYLTLGIEPFEYVYETSPTNERINWVMSHELLHIVASDQASSSDEFFRSIFFGKVVAIPEAPITMLYSYLTAPRRYAPRWYHEGAAVFLETWMAGGYGRALGGYDEMVFRTMVHDSAYFYDFVGLESEGTTIDFQIGQMSYLYGTRFISYMAYNYGPEKLIDWIKRTKGSKRHYSAQFKHVYGLALDDEWSRWIEWEHQWQKSNLDSVRQYDVTQFRPLSRKPLGSVSRAYYDPRKRRLITAALYPGEYGHIVAIDVDTWKAEKITKVSTPALYYVTSLAYDDSTGAIFYTTDNSRRWRDLNAVDISSGTKMRLIADCRTGDLVFNRADKSVWGVQHHNGISSIVRFLPPYEEWTYVLTLPYGKDIFDLDISPDGKYLTAAMIEVSGRQRLIRMDIDLLVAGDSFYEVLHEFPGYSPANFVFSPDGRFLYGTSYYTGVSNVFRYDFEKKEMEAITNAQTGFFRPVPVSDDSLIAFHYSSAGFTPVMIPIEPLKDVAPIRFLGQAIVQRHPVVTSWMLGSPREVNIDSLTIAAGDYSGFRSIELSAAYPIVESYKDHTAFGMRFDFMEPTGLHSLDVSASYTPTGNLPDRERTHVKANYNSYPWHLSGSFNGTDFYDLFGPTKTSRKGYSLSVRYMNSFINEKPRRLDYTIGVAGYGGLERLPEYQNVAASFEEYLTASAGLHFHSFSKTIGSVENESGTEWRFRTLNNYVNSNNFQRAWADLNYGFLLPWDHSSIWLRTTSGYSWGNRFEPFANFFFGGFGNNWVDHGEVKRYRQYYSFPGVELNEVAGTNYAKAMLEWTLPPLRFRRMGLPSLYTNWAHLTLFSSCLSTNMDDSIVRRTVGNVGAQVDFRIILFSALPSTFSLGYAAAVEKDESPSYEFMISLKIL